RCRRSSGPAPIATLPLHATVLRCALRARGISRSRCPDPRTPPLPTLPSAIAPPVLPWIVTLDLYGLALGKVFYPVWERLRGRPTFELLDTLRRTERASLDELAALRSGLLRRLVRHAYHHPPYYRRVLDLAGVHPDHVRTVED